MTSGGWSKPRLARMHEAMARHVERGDMPGLVTLVARRGEVHVDAIGTLAIDSDRPMQRDTIFRIASVTKPITAVAAMILVEECVLRLDDPVDALLPELANRRVLRRLHGPLDDTVPANRAITLRDLLTFTMGIGTIMAPPDTHAIQTAIRERDIGGDGPPRPGKTPEPDEWMRRLGELPLVHQPGERWMYNVSADVLGVLIARASGQPFDAFLRERIFEPLRMKDTGFSVPTSSTDRFATSYSPNAETAALELYDPATNGQWNRPPAFQSGAGGLVSTVDDLLAFGHMMANMGTLHGTRILSRTSIETMTIDQLTPEQKAGPRPDVVDFDDRSWGLGMSVVTRRSTSMSVGTFGWDGGLGTSWAVDPREDLVGILLTQRAWDSPAPPLVWRDFWTSAYQAIDD